MKRKARKPMGQIPPEDLSLFCQQTALILRSAIPLEDGLFAIAEGLPKEGAQLVSELGETVSSTGSFSGALEKAGVFPSYLTSMAVIGESSGKLEEVLTALGEYYDRESRLKRQIRSAILYPMLSVLLMTAVIGVLVFRVLPIFRRVLESLGVGTSGGSLMNLGYGFGVGVLVFLLAVIFLSLLALFLSKWKKGRRFLLKICRHVKPARELTDKIAASRFASVLSMLLSSGYHAEDAMVEIPKILPEGAAAEKVEKVRKRMEEGQSLADAIEGEGLFPGLYGRMVGVGSRTGALDKVLQRLATLYEEETDEAIQAAVGSIEPVMVGLLSVVIGGILLSVMLPLLGALSAIG